jgi:hypothetical protein
MPEGEVNATGAAKGFLSAIRREYAQWLTAIRRAALAPKPALSMRGRSEQSGLVGMRCHDRSLPRDLGESLESSVYCGLMPQRTETRSVELTTDAPVEIASGIVMPAGVYVGELQRTAFTHQGGTSWSRPQYTIEFSAEELETMGHKSPHRSESFDVSEFVRSGEITVS